MSGEARDGRRVVVVDGSKSNDRVPEEEEEEEGRSKRRLGAEGEVEGEVEVRSEWLTALRRSGDDSDLGEMEPGGGEVAR